MIKLITYFLVLLRPFFTRLGIDFTQMRVIVAAKLTVNDRIRKNGKENKDSNNMMLRQGILMGISGALIFFIALRQGSLSNALLFFHMLLFFSVFMNFLTEYSQLLFNSNDNEILQRLPVASKTTLAAKIVSMLLHLLFITLCLSILPFLIILFWKGVPAGLSFFIGTILNTLFTLLLANLFYTTMLRYVSAERFDKFLTYVQFVMVIILVLAYQAASRLSSQLCIDFTAPIPMWMYFTPPCYFMSITELVLKPSYQAALLAILGIVANILLFGTTISRFGASFSTKINQIKDWEGSRRPLKTKKIAYLLSRLVTKHPLQRSGFILTWRLTGDNMKFKQTVYVMLASIIISACLPVYHIFTLQSDSIHFTFASLIPFYLLPLVTMVVIPMLGINDKANMLWIYQSKPIAKPGLFLLGCFKVFYIKYQLPIFLPFFFLYLILYGLAPLADLVLIFSFSTLFSFAYYLMNGLLFPFSKEQSAPQSQFFKIFLIMGLAGIIATGHFLLKQIPYANIIAIPVTWGIIFLCYRTLVNISWEKIEKQY